MKDGEQKRGWIQLDGKNINTDDLDAETAGQVERDIQKYEELLAAARVKGDRQAEAEATCQIARILFLSAQLYQSGSYIKEALSIYLELGEHQEVASCHAQIADICLALQDWDGAQEHYEKALETMENAGDRSGVVKYLNSLGSLFLLLRNPQKAAEYFQQALEIAKNLSDRNVEAKVMVNLATAYMTAGNLNRALEQLEQALALSRIGDNRAEELRILNNSGTCHLHLGNFPAALDAFQQAYTLSQKIEHREYQAETLREIGMVYYRMQDIENAISHTESAVQIYEEIGGPGEDRAREQLEDFRKFVPKRLSFTAFVPVVLIFVLIIMIFVFAGRQKGPSSQSKTAIAGEQATFEAKYGSIQGKVLDKNGQPLAKLFQGDEGIIVLLCTDNNKKQECLQDRDMELSALIGSICKIYELDKKCLLHEGKSAAYIQADGSYRLNYISPGQYDLMLIILNNGIGLSITLINVDPVQAGSVTNYDFLTE